MVQYAVASRAMIITGKSVWKAKDEIENLSNSDSCSINRTWPKLFSNSGYMTYMSGKWHVNAPVEKIFDIVKNVKPGMPDDNRAKLYENISRWKEESGKLIDFENYMPIGYARPKNERDQSWNSMIQFLVDFGRVANTGVRFWQTMQSIFWKNQKIIMRHISCIYLLMRLMILDKLLKNF